MTKPNCKKCKSELTNRMVRRGFFENVLLFRLGLFPWECSKCRVVFYSKERGVRNRRTEHPGASSMSTS